MVRMTIACARCRKLKIKCVHTGTAPCRNCSRKGQSESQACLLSEPELKHNAARRGSGHRPEAAAKRRLILQAIPSSPSSPTPVDNQQQRQAQPARSPSRQSRPRQKDAQEQDDIFGTTDVTAILSIFSIFTQKFSELRFIHRPSFAKHLRQAWHDENHAARHKLRLLCAAVIALCTPPRRQPDDSESPTPSPERCADFVRHHVSVFMPPDLLTVQTLVVLSMYEWGMGRGYRAWMLAGSASRMMQSLPAFIKSPALSPIEHEEQSRTFWSCFILDRMIYCGQPQPFLLSMYDKAARWPSSETDYIFGSGPAASSLSNKAEEHHDVDRDKLNGYDMDHYYGVLIQGFDIWARVLKFTVTGGRRMTGMSRPENHPWVDGSPWLLLYNELQAWRQRMDERLRYPLTPVEGHAAMGHAEQFGYINLIYYIALLFLTREYIPLLPTLEAEPTGPVDPPLLSVPAPVGWWAERSAELFSSASYIVQILSDVEDNGASLNSPFAGFCSFSAATMNLYVQCFPNMNLGRSSGPALQSVICENLRYLNAFQEVWPMGAGWWMTIQHLQKLLEQANQNKTPHSGRMRDDFEALEPCIYDVRGKPLQDGAVDSAATVTSSLPPQAPITLPPVRSHMAEEVPATSLPFHTPLSYGIEAADTALSQTWPLWGQQHTLPFALEGLPLDYNLGLIDMFQA